MPLARRFLLRRLTDVTSDARLVPPDEDQLFRQGACDGHGSRPQAQTDRRERNACEPPVCRWTIHPSARRMSGVFDSALAVVGLP